MTSSHVAPNAMHVTLAGTDVGFVIVATNCDLTGEKIRIVSAEASSIRLESDDQINRCVAVVKSADNVITRSISSERVSRILSFDGSMVAMYAPSGLGKARDDAEDHESVSKWPR